MPLFGFGRVSGGVEGRRRVEELRKRLKASPTNVPCALALADALAENGSVDEAARILNPLGPSLERNGQYLAAIAVYRKIAALDPGAREAGTASSLTELRRLERAARSKTLPEPAVRSTTGVTSILTAEDKEVQRKRQTLEPFLKSIPLFKDVPFNLLYDLVERMHLRTFDAGVTIFKEGDQGSSILFIVSGEIEVLGSGEAGGEIPLRILREGDVAGEVSFLSALSRTATLKTLAPTALLELERRAVDPLVRKSPSLREALTTLYRERVLNDVLVRSSLFGAIPAERRDEIARCLVPVSVDAGASIDLSGPDEDLFLISRGIVRISSLEDGKENGRAMLSPPAFFGNMKPPAGEPPVVAAALTDVELFRLPTDALALVLRDFPALWQKLEEIQIRRLGLAPHAG